MYEHRNYQFKHPYSSVTPPLLRKYPGAWFIETGTNVGLGVSAAIGAGCFQQILSFENDYALYDEVSRMYTGLPNVRLLYMDSDAGLRLFCPDLIEPCTFYLDAHAEGHNPLLQELDAIATSLCQTHTILIDDVRMFGSAGWNGLTFEQVAERLRDLNPHYRFSYEDTKNAPRDLLVVTP